jgi:hypothetical protein
MISLKKKVGIFKYTKCLAQWLMPVISTIQEAEIGRISVPGQSGQKVCETPISISKNWMWYNPVIPAT